MPIVAMIAQPSADPLPSWREVHATKRAILEFLRKTTSWQSSDYLPPSARIAVFDNDGTLWVEQPVIEVAFAVDRLKAPAPHSEWATREVFRCAGRRYGEPGKGGLRAMGAIVLATHAETTPDTFHELVSSWLVSAATPLPPSLHEMHLSADAGGADTVSCPWLRTWIVTGAPRIPSTLTPGVYGVPPDQVVGTTLKSALFHARRPGRCGATPARLESLDEAGKVVNL